MRITHSVKLSKKDIPVFVLKKGEKISSHSFFKYLSKESQQHLERFSKKHSLGEKGYTHVVFLPEGRSTLVAGVGRAKDFSLRRSFLTIRRIVRFARKEKIKNLAINPEDFYASDVEYLVANAHMANFEFDQYKSKKQAGIQRLTFVSKKTKGISTALKAGNIVGEAVNTMRSLSNIPGGDMTPASLAYAAQKTGKKAGFRVRVLQEKAIKRLKMGGILGVSKGSKQRPRFIILEYFKGKKNERPLVFVGKGITFDTGGLNIKPGDSMYEMHMDMSGGAAVLAVMQAVTRLKLKKNVIGLIPAAENMVSGESYRPGDVIKTMSGKTVEVLNTDAEGRLVLADALTYAKKYKPRLVVDVATLTGASVVALGQRASAIFTNDEKLEKLLRDIGEKTGDYVWPLPLWEEYEDEVKGTFADVANLGKTRYGGAITAAVFLWQFVKSPSSASGQAYPWAHIDIAPRMTSIEGDHLARGSAGAAVALLTQLTREY